MSNNKIFVPAGALNSELYNVSLDIDTFFVELRRSIKSFKDMKFDTKTIHPDHNCWRGCHSIYLTRFGVWKEYATALVSQYLTNDQEDDKIFVSASWRDLLQVLRIMWKSSNKKIYSAFEIPEALGESMLFYFSSRSVFYWNHANPNVKCTNQMNSKSPEHRKSKESDKERDIKIKSARERKLSKVLFQAGLFDAFGRATKTVENTEKITTALSQVLFEGDTGKTGIDVATKTLDYLREVLSTVDLSGVTPQSAAKDILDTCTKAKSGISTIDDILSSVKTSLGNMLDKIFKHGPTFLLICCVISWGIYRNTKTAVAAMVLLAIVGYQKRVWLQSKLIDLYSYFTAPLHQDGIEDTANLANVLLSVFQIKKTEASWSSINGCLGGYDRRTSGIKEFLHFVKKVIVRIYNLVATYTPLNKLYTFPRGHDELSESVFDTWESICRRIDNNDFPYTEETYGELMNLMRTCREFVNSFKMTNTNRHVYMEVTRLQTEMRKLRDKMAASNFRESGFRVEPVTLVLCGIPGVGKSNLIEYISLDFCMKTLPQSDREHIRRMGHCNDYMYVRVTENDHWDGYSSKSTVAIFDDLGQKKASTSSEDEYLQFVRASQSFEYLLRMAALEYKGNTHFRSNLIICTSNILGEFNSPHIKENAALARRLKFRFKVIVKQEYAAEDGKLDKSKLPLDEEGTPYFDERMFHFESLDAKGNQCVRDGRVIHTYDQLMKLVMEEMHHNRDLRNSKEKYIAKRIEKFFEQDLEMEPVHQAGLNSDFELDDEVVRPVPFTSKDPLIASIEELYYMAAFACGPAVLSVLGGIFAGMFLVGAYQTAKGIYAITKWTKDKIMNFEFMSDKDKEDVLLDQVSYYKDVVYQYEMRHKDSKKNATNRIAKLRTDLSNQGFGTGDKQCDVIVKKIFKENVYRIAAKVPSGELKVGFGIFVRGRSMLIPMHFVTSFAELIAKHGQECVILAYPMWGNTNLPIEIERKVWIEAFDKMEHNDGVITRDSCIIKMPLAFKCHKDIVKFFFTENELKKHESCNVQFITLHEHVWMHHEAKAFSLSKRAMVVESSTITTITDFGFAYGVNTAAGDCGTPIFMVNKFTQNEKITGIHVAGNETSKLGFSQHVTQEWIEDQIKDEVVFPFVKAAEVPEVIQLQGRFQVVGTLPLKHSPYNKSEIQKSVFHPDINIGSKFECDNLPARLSPFTHDGERVDPYEKALANYIPSAKYAPNKSVLHNAVQVVKERMLECIPVSEYRTFTFEEAVAGIPEMETFRALRRASSSGYPYSKKGISKSDIFGPTGPFQFDTPLAQELKQHVASIIRDARVGIRHEHIFTDNLKDETRSKAKVQSGATRLFCGAPLAYTIAFRMAFGNFMGDFQKIGLKFGSAIGLNPYAEDWHELALRLLSKGHKPENARYGAGDYKAFDASEVSEVHWFIFSIIDTVYRVNGNNDTLLRRVLWEDLVNSQHIVFGARYEWCSSLPSGHPLTSIVNTLYNHLAFNYCFLRMQLDQGHWDWQFYDHIYLTAMGDDNLYACSEVVAKHFGESIVAKYMSELGLNYTSDTKEISADGLRTLYQVSFLKRKFRFDNRGKVHMFKWVAPIDLKVIYDTPCWYKIGPVPKDELLISNLKSSLCELSIHGEQVFEEHVRVFKQAMATLPFEISVPWIDYVTARLAVADMGAIY